MKKRGFTLIELLIVVAIIGILAAIAVPNFMNAQVRAKVARVYSDMNAIEKAQEMYRIDHNRFTMCADLKTGAMKPGRLSRFDGLTSPIAYISAIPTDSFPDESKPLAAGGDEV